jgi:hypothetical protein
MSFIPEGIDHGPIQAEVAGNLLVLEQTFLGTTGFRATRFLCLGWCIEPFLSRI